MKRKYSECEEFKHLVDEAIMRCGGDESLDIFASQKYKGDTDRSELCFLRQKFGHRCFFDTWKSETELCNRIEIICLNHKKFLIFFLIFESSNVAAKEKTAVCFTCDSKYHTCDAADDCRKNSVSRWKFTCIMRLFLRFQEISGKAWYHSW